jgi:molybdopterin-guanine dinucleotide biosynthesis protein B
LIPSPPAVPAPDESCNPRKKTVALVGPSSSGKTWLICDLLAWFRDRGLRVAVLKHSHKLHLGDDHKDTGRFRGAGATLVALAAPDLLQITRSCPGEPPLEAILDRLAPDADLILVEGYKSSDLPKLGVAAPEDRQALPDYANLLAWVSPEPLATSLPVFKPDQVEEIGGFILARLRQPGAGAF